MAEILLLQTVWWAWRGGGLSTSADAVHGSSVVYGRWRRGVAVVCVCLYVRMYVPANDFIF